MADKIPHIGANASQMKAIAHRAGPAMVLAGPGSGKTFVITQRIRYLIEVSHTDPSTILTITFTKAAAAEMRSRFMKLTENRYPECVFGTFHSVFLHILTTYRDSTGQEQVKIIPEQEKYRIIRMSLTDRKVQHPELVVTSELAGQYLSEIAKRKGGMRDCGIPDAGRRSKMREHAADCAVPYPEVFEQVYRDYEARLKELGYIDFEDMLLDCLRLFSENAQVLDLWRRRFRHIQIDEYQDINRVQYEVIWLLASPADNLFVVGDDDQSIYAFRGSDPSYMLGFEQAYPEARVYRLDRNYRCRKEIIDVASLVIGQNKNRIGKTQTAGRDDAGEVLLNEYPTAAEETAAIAAWLRDGTNDKAIIVRTNHQAASLAEQLRVSGADVCGYEQITGRKTGREQVKDLIAYLKLASPHATQADYYRVMNRPVRYLSRESLTQSTFSMEQVEAWYRDRPSMRETIARFKKDLKLIGTMRPALSIRYIRTQMGYDAWLKKEIGADAYEKAAAVLDELQNKALQYTGSDAFIRAVTMEEEEHKERRKEPVSARKGTGVRILTMHASKGLEYDAVWLPAVNEGQIPSRKSILPDEIEEERRLFYVAMTRARHSLIISYQTGTDNYRCVPSRFLRPLL